jgi:hypothetical protein
MDIPNGARVCPHCRTKQGTSGCVTVAVIVIALFIIFPMSQGMKSASKKNEPDKPAVTTTAVTTKPITETEKQSLIDSITGMTKSTYGKNYEVTYDSTFNFYSVRVWDDKITEASKSEDTKEWDKIKEQAVSFESRLNQQVKSVDETAYASFSFSSAEKDYEGLLLISDGELLFDFGYKEPEETTAPEETPVTTTYPKINGFLIGDREGTTYDGYCEVVGVVANATGYNCSYVQITIGFYNENNVKVDSGIDNILNLSAGETWQYEVTGFGDGITNFIIDDITWY